MAIFRLHHGEPVTEEKLTKSTEDKHFKHRRNLIAGQFVKELKTLGEFDTCLKSSSPYCKWRIPLEIHYQFISS